MTSAFTQFRETMARLVDRVAPAIEADNGLSMWDVTADAVAQIPPRLRDRMASEFLIDAYLRRPAPEVAVEPAQIKPPRKRYPSRPLSELAQAELDVELSEIDKRFKASVDKAMSIYKASLFDEWSAEALADRFHLEDGTSVTWAEATRNQHRMASINHQINGADALKQASRHEVAIDLLDQSGASCLADAVCAPSTT